MAYNNFDEEAEEFLEKAKASAKSDPTGNIVTGFSSLSIAASLRSISQKLDNIERRLKG